MATKMTPLMFAQKYFEMDVFFYPQDLAGGMAAYVPARRYFKWVKLGIPFIAPLSGSRWNPVA